MACSGLGPAYGQQGGLSVPDPCGLYASVVPEAGLVLEAPMQEPQLPGTLR